MYMIYIYIYMYIRIGCFKTDDKYFNEILYFNERFFYNILKQIST